MILRKYQCFDLLSKKELASKGYRLLEDLSHILKVVIAQTDVYNTFFKVAALINAVK